MSAINFNVIEPAILQFFMELWALKKGSSHAKLERLTSVTDPTIILYTKTGTLTFPRIYLDGIIFQKHFY